MTKKEAAIVEIYTGVCMLTGKSRKYIYNYASELMGRPVLTHELASEELQQKSKKDFIKLCRHLTDVDKSMEQLLREGTATLSRAGNCISELMDRNAELEKENEQLRQVLKMKTDGGKSDE